MQYLNPLDFSININNKEITIRIPYDKEHVDDVIKLLSYFKYNADKVY